MRITALVAFCERVRDEMLRIVDGGVPVERPGAPAEQAGPSEQAGPREQAGPSERAGPEVVALLGSIRAAASRVEELCRNSPSRLSDPSRRAYLWLKFLSDEGRLREHLGSLRAAAALIAARVAPPQPGEPVGPMLRADEVRLDFYNTPALYRVRFEDRGRRMVVTANEGFIAASPEVLEALVGLALDGGRDGGRPGRRRRDGLLLARVREFCRGPEYASIVRALESGDGFAQSEGALAGPAARGLHYDLGEIFERVNGAYFDGGVARPVLVWSRGASRRTFGRYEPAPDRVTLSRALDCADIPAFVVDFVMYHELLHKRLGVGVANGRQRAHTRAFREAERKFARYEEAQGFLRLLGRQGGPGGRGQPGRRSQPGGRGQPGRWNGQGRRKTRWSPTAGAGAR